MASKKIIFSAFAACVISGVAIFNLSFTNKLSADWTTSTPVYQALNEVGDAKPAFFPADMNEKLVKQGYELVNNGRTNKPDGKGKSKYISLLYVCTNCHNTVIEDPVLTISDPEARLKYAVQNKLPFLQGTTMFGAVNRETWYNDDYYKKYGDLVKPAYHDIREAIQLCARECSEGRTLEPWEVQSIVAYLYSISYTLKDIGFTDADIKKLNARKAKSSEQNNLIALIKSKYELKSPATFIEPPYERDWQTVKGDADNGKLVFEYSCQQCHKPYGVSDVIFDNSKYTFNKFQREFDKNYWWLYEKVRKGTYAAPGHRSYMPLYPKERMSNQQVDDLKAYFDREAGSL